MVAIKLKKTTSEVIRTSIEQRGGGRRGRITEISQASIKNAKEILANADPELNSMVVATYGKTWPADGRVVNAHHKALSQAIERRFGSFSYFTAKEYQKRGAPHLHKALSIDLAKQGEVITLKRKKSGRRCLAFQTVQWAQDWAFETWLDIIRKPNPRYNGVQLEWPGLSAEDEQAMRKAYTVYNAGFAWEVMRVKDGAKRYLVKELGGLKGYQKQIPDDIEHPGRHFLYSRDMKFNEDEAIYFVISEAEARALLERAGWGYLPEEHKPLYKRLWNTAAILATELIKAGYQPIKGCIEQLRQYSDLRMWWFADRTAEAWKAINQWADFRMGWKSVRHWEAVKRRMIYDERWAYAMANGP